MEKGIYFFYQDRDCGERQSIGVYITKDSRCIIREPIFYCPEWSVIWIGLGNITQGIGKSKDVNNIILTPMSLREIIDVDLGNYVSGVLDTREASKVILF